MHATSARGGAGAAAATISASCVPVPIGSCARAATIARLCGARVAPRRIVETASSAAARPSPRSAGWPERRATCRSACQRTSAQLNARSSSASWYELSPRSNHPSAGTDPLRPPRRRVLEVRRRASLGRHIPSIDWLSLQAAASHRGQAIGRPERPPDSHGYPPPTVASIWKLPGRVQKTQYLLHHHRQVPFLHINCRRRRPTQALEAHLVR
jgi:hypothetical protein